MLTDLIGKEVINNETKEEGFVRAVTSSRGGCRDCIELANPRRIAKGWPPIPIHPHAYEPEDENA